MMVSHKLGRHEILFVRALKIATNYVLLGITLMGLVACGGGNTTSTPPPVPVASPPPPPPSPDSAPMPPPMPEIISENPRVDLSGLDVTLTINEASSFTLPDGGFAVAGDVTRSFLDANNMFARTVAENADEYTGSYDYASLDANTSRETTTLSDGRIYETTYSFTDDMSGTWEESFDLGEITSSGTFTLKPTAIVTNAEGNFNLSQIFDGRTRTQLVHLPPNFSPDENLPMILALHGSTNEDESAIPFLQLTELGTLGDEERVVVIFPRAARAVFNGNSEVNWNTDIGLGIDDVGFLGTVIDNAIAELGLDPEGVYTTGFSNGAFMSAILTCEMGERISGLATVAGHIGINRTTCLGDNNVPSIFFHGDADTVVPISGRANQFNSTASTVNLFADELGCGTTQTSDQLPDIDMTDGSTVLRRIQDDCPEDTGLEFYIIQNGRHRWPGGNLSIASPDTNRDISASRVLWDFFARFR